MPRCYARIDAPPALEANLRWAVQTAMLTALWRFLASLPARCRAWITRRA
jgi:hypothetical protein